MAEDTPPIFEQIKDYLFKYYSPAESLADAEFHYTTHELWHQLMSIFPDYENFPVHLVATWMNEGGFIFADFGELKFEWLLKKRYI